MKSRLVAIVAWTLAVVVADLYFGGGQVAPCLGGPGGNQPCIDAWQAAHPAPPPIFDITQPWPWLVVYVSGLVVILAVERLRPSR